MENIAHQDHQNNQMEILKFMEVTQCESYDQAKLFVTMHGYVLKDAVEAYLLGKTKEKSQNRTVVQPNSLQSPYRLQQPQSSQQYQDSNIQQLSLTQQQARMLQHRLSNRSITNQTSNSIPSPKPRLLCPFKCFYSLKKSLKRKLNSFRNDDDKIHYFTELYQDELRQTAMLDVLVEGFELSSVQESQKLTVTKGQASKAIFAMIVGNRRSQVIADIVKRQDLMQFLRQNFEVVFLTLSQLKQLNLPRSHILRNISKCPTAIAYTKNYYNLEDTLIKFQGQSIKSLSLEKLQSSLKQLPKLLKKWTYMQQLQQHLRQNSISVRDMLQYGEYDDGDSFGDVEEGQNNSSFVGSLDSSHETKKALIQEQTKIYEEMAAEETRRKKSAEIQKQKIDEVKQLRQVRKLSLPEQPGLDQLHQSIQFKFRCPLNGSYITRRFLKTQKLDILYQFVDTCDQIQFQTQPQRNFQLFSSFPPTPLQTKRQKPLNQVFDQQKQNILIREI